MILEKILHTQGFGSRKTVRLMIYNEEVTVNGHLCDDPNADFSLHELNYTVHGEPWQYREKSYLVLNKPANYECSHKPIHHPSIYNLLPRPLIERAVQCIGRLDEDTTGLILLSDDGQFIHRMSSPKYKVPKVYQVTCKYPVDDKQIATLKAGVKLVDDPATVVALECEKISNNIIHMTLGEGKYHQVKRMMAAVSNRVEALHRIQIGELRLTNELKFGEWRWLTQTDLVNLAPQN